MHPTSAKFHISATSALKATSWPQRALDVALFSSSSLMVVSVQSFANVSRTFISSKAFGSPFFSMATSTSTTTLALDYVRWINPLIPWCNLLINPRAYYIRCKAPISSKNGKERKIEKDNLTSCMSTSSKSPS